MCKKIVYMITTCESTPPRACTHTHTHTHTHAHKQTHTHTHTHAHKHTHTHTCTHNTLLYKAGQQRHLLSWCINKVCSKCTQTYFHGLFERDTVTNNVYSHCHYIFYYQLIILQMYEMCHSQLTWIIYSSIYSRMFGMGYKFTSEFVLSCSAAI